jgi:hypothetical protein
MSGSVYIFNCSPFLTNLSINGFALQVASMQPAVLSSTPPYSPDQMPVPRSVTSQQGDFTDKYTNVITVQVLMGNQEINSDPINIFIDTDSAPTSDLWLYLYPSNQQVTVVMFDTLGRLQPGFPTTVGWPSSVSIDEVLVVEESM